MTRPDPRADLCAAFRDMSDEELAERWAGGQLTELAMEVARAEFARRGIEPPAIALPEPAQDEAPGGAIVFATVARSLMPTELQVLRARLESEGIPAFVADGEINRMNSLWSIAVGGARLLVPRQYEAEARQIIAHVKSGRFALREGDAEGDPPPG
jgi:hypothetical protein